MGKDKDDIVYGIQLYYPSPASCIGLKVLDLKLKISPSNKL